MQATEVLTVVAEISIALAGFTGIVVAYRQRGLDELLPHELVRLRFMLGVACTTLLFAFLPFLPHYFGLAPSSTWIVSSAAMAVGLLFLALTIYSRAKSHLNRMSLAWFVTYVAGSALFALMALTNTLELLGPPGPGQYLAGLGWLLFVSISLFVRLILAPLSPQ